MKKKMIYILVVLLLIMTQLVVEEYDMESQNVNTVNTTSEIFLEVADKDDSNETEDLSPGIRVAGYIEIEGEYGPTLVKTDREIGNDENNKLCRLNRMNQERLMTLKGIGEVTAGKILDYKAKKGYFKRLEDLMEVKGIGPKKYTSIEEQL